MKKCITCNQEKLLEDYYKNVRNLDGRFGECKKCCKVRNASWREKNPDYLQKWYLENPNYLKEWMEQNPNYMKQWEEKNPNSYSDYYKNNIEHVKKRTQEYATRRREVDPLFKTICGVRALVGGSFSRACKGLYKKSKLTEEILGCSMQEFLKYIENKFQEGMTLDNHGKWHFDHIIPISSAQTLEEIYKLNHYTNFQPLYWEDNLKKSDKYLE